MVSSCKFSKFLGFTQLGSVSYYHNASHGGWFGYLQVMTMAKYLLFGIKHLNCFYFIQCNSLHLVYKYALWLSSLGFLNGWQIAKTSLQVLNAHKELIIFPILSALSLLLIVASFVTVLFARVGWNIDRFQIGEINPGFQYMFVFLFYIVNYFVVVFFNMALMHCARLYFEGEEVSISKGFQFSMSRIGAIFSWAVFAATVGTVLKIAQDNLGWVGKIISGIAGIVWSVATFFVVPIIAYENLGPIEAVKRSSRMMKEKWGD
jgi:hypothetical protein